MAGRSIAASVVVLAIVVLAGCSGPPGSSTTSPMAAHVTASGLLMCPWAGGDAGIASPTFIEPDKQVSRGPIRLVVPATASDGPTIRAIVKAPGRAHGFASPSSPIIVVASRIVLVREADEDVLGINPTAPTVQLPQLLAARNVVASSRVVRSADTQNHLLTLRVPAGLQPRTYVIEGVQQVTPQCRPVQTAQIDHVIGSVRISQ
jgi:hypothetical protein